MTSRIMVFQRRQLTNCAHATAFCLLHHCPAYMHFFLLVSFVCIYTICVRLWKGSLCWLLKKKKNYISNYYLIGRETPGSSSKYEHLSSYISGFCGAAFTGEASDLLMRSMGYALVTTTIIASTPVQILLLCFLSAGRHWRRHPRSPEGIQDLH